MKRNIYKDDLIVVMTTESSIEKAKTLGLKILREKLAACISFQGISSNYFWENKIEESEEIKLLIKTKKSKRDILINFINNYHSYDLPELIIFECDSTKAYSDWIGDYVL